MRSEVSKAVKIDGFLIPPSYPHVITYHSAENCYPLLYNLMMEIAGSSETRLRFIITQKTEA
jgi:hypothetical protein